MERLKLESIKRESVESTFNILARGGVFTRAELAEATGLSLMTIGKSVEMLERNKALISHKKPSDKVGRKSAICQLNTNCVMLVYDLFKIPNRLHLCDIMLNVFASYDLDPNNPVETEMNAFIEQLNERSVIGTACVLPDDGGEASENVFIERLGRKPDLIINGTDARAISCASRFDTETGVFIFVDNHTDRVSGSIVYRGDIIKGDHGSANRIDLLVKMLGNFEKSIAAICLLIDPSLIHIECSTDSCRAGISGIIESELTQLTGSDEREIIVETTVNGYDAVNGAARLLRSLWVRGLK